MGGVKAVSEFIEEKQHLNQLLNFYLNSEKPEDLDVFIVVTQEEGRKEGYDFSEKQILDLVFVKTIVRTSYI